MDLDYNNVNTLNSSIMKIMNTEIPYLKGPKNYIHCDPQSFVLVFSLPSEEPCLVLVNFTLRIFS